MRKWFNIISSIIAALLILLFTYTAINKLTGYDRFVTIIGHSPLAGPLKYFVAIGIPLAEIILVILLFMPKYRLLGLWGSLLLMMAFTAYIGISLGLAAKLPCACGGVLSQWTWKQHLVFNSAFTLITAIGVYTATKHKQFIAIKQG